MSGPNLLENLEKRAVARIVLLTQPDWVPTVAPVLGAAGAAVQPVFTRAELEAVAAAGTADTRLVAFAAGVIVPQAILSAFPGPSYNFHPGPPAYPGLFPSVYALYDGAPTFGVTLHEMTRAIDAGPIVAVDSFAVPAACDRLNLDFLALKAMLAQLERLAPALADVATPLPRIAAAWSGPGRTRADFDALCALPDDVTADEFARRLRAVGEGPHHALSFQRFGRNFRLVSDRGTILRGGQTV